MKLLIKVIALVVTAMYFTLVFQSCTVVRHKKTITSDSTAVSKDSTVRVDSGSVHNGLDLNWWKEVTIPSYAGSDNFIIDSNTWYGSRIYERLATPRPDTIYRKDTMIIQMKPVYNYSTQPVLIREGGHLSVSFDSSYFERILQQRLDSLSVTKSTQTVDSKTKTFTFWHLLGAALVGMVLFYILNTVFKNGGQILKRTL